MMSGWTVMNGKSFQILWNSTKIMKILNLTSSDQIKVATDLHRKVATSAEGRQFKKNPIGPLRQNQHEFLQYMPSSDSTAGNRLVGFPLRQALLFFASHPGTWGKHLICVHCGSRDSKQNMKLIMKTYQNCISDCWLGPSHTIWLTGHSNHVKHLHDFRTGFKSRS